MHVNSESIAEIKKYRNVVYHYPSALCFHINLQLNPTTQLSPRSLRKLYQAVKSRTIAIGVKEDDKPADKVPKKPNHVSIEFNEE
jgi:hypothetical protein